MPVRKRLSNEEIKEFIDKMLNYAEAKEVPTLAGFCYSQRITKEELNHLAKKYNKIKEGIKMFYLIQEDKIVQGASKQKLNPTFGIFSLKQKPFFWEDKADVKANIKFPQVVIEKRKKKKNKNDSKKKQSRP